MCKVLVVFKKSMYEIYFGDNQTESHMKQISFDHNFSPIDVDRLKASNLSHSKTLKNVFDYLDEVGIKYDKVYRASDVDYSGYETIIAVGGDGTFLEASHNITTQTILGINSDSSRSVGHFCCCDQYNFSTYIDALVSGKFQTTSIPRMSLDTGGEVRHVLNDVLIAHETPAAMSKYLISVGEVQDEFQRGSGLWVSTAVGSTCAISSAGGVIMPPTLEKLQYRIREPFDGITLKHGIVDKLKVTSKMREGMIYVDGAHHKIKFGFNKKITMSVSKFPLNIITGE